MNPLTLVVTAVIATPALAHGGGPAAAHSSSAWNTVLATWTWDPLVLGSVALSAVFYVLGLRSLRGAGFRWWEIAAFILGLTSVLIALVSPLDALSDALFSAHMSQHEILMLVSAPLLVVGRPLIAFLWAFGPKQRERIARWTQRATVRRVWRTATMPVLVLLVHGIAVWIWHLPGLFEAALASEAVHAVQHACFFVTAALFWWTLLHGRYGRSGYVVAVAYVFATATHTGLLGALVTFARRAWYPTYERTTVELGVSAVEDQQLAGLIMWIPAGVLLLIFALAFLAAWLGEAERRVRHTQADATGGELR
jgi:putative membrane protein